MQECWDENPQNRPTFPELRSQFDAMLAKDNPYIQFGTLNSHKDYYHSHHHHRDSHSEDSTLQLSDTTNEFSPCTSSITLNGAHSPIISNGATASGYDYLTPIEPTVTIVSHDDTQHHMANPYVDTPTSKHPRSGASAVMRDRSRTRSGIDFELEQIQISVIEACVGEECNLHCTHSMHDTV